MSQKKKTEDNLFVPRKFEIPEERMEEALGLWDQVDRRPSEMARYKLWRLIASIFPEVIEGHWKLSRHNAFTITITEQPE